MAGELQLNSTTFATESAGTITVSNVDSATNRQNLGLEIGVDVQSYDADTTKNDVANTFTANQIISVTDNTNAALRITQLGTGNALVVEDSTNPDSTPFVVDASGRIGIGTSAPTQAGLVIDKIGTDGNTSAKMAFKSNETAADTYLRIARYGSAADSILSITNNYNRDGGTFSADYSSFGVTAISFNDGYLGFSTGAAGQNLPTERMRIDSSGNVNINNLSASSDVQTDASKNLITTSDARLKNDLGVITDSAINVVQQIIPKYFSWKNDGNNTQQLGFFAQDIYPVLPEAAPRALKYIEVGKDENDEPILEQVFDEDGNPDYEWGFTDRPIIAMCVKAIQEQQALIESQQSQIDALTARIEALETT